MWPRPVSQTLFCTVADLEVLFLNFFKAETKVLDTEIYPQHTIADLNYGTTFVFFQLGEAFRMKGNKHTRTHAHTHTHTHTFTHTRTRHLVKNARP